MNRAWTIDEVIQGLWEVKVPQLAAPLYNRPADETYLKGVALAVESMSRHMTDEGWQIMQALQYNGYELAGYRLPVNIVDVPTILARVNPSAVFVQDKREWEPRQVIRDGRSYKRDEVDESSRFTNYRILKERADLFKMTIIKDVEFDPEWNRDFADDIGCNAWVTYYNPRVVCHLGSYIRPQHLIRTYHTIDRMIVPPYSSKKRHGCLLSGAISSHYPLRQRLWKEHMKLPYVYCLKHPGYHRDGCATPQFFRVLSGFKIAIVTCTKYAFAVRKFMEATAAGCMVVTNLPKDECLPVIDDNLYRIHPDAPIQEIAELISDCLSNYDSDKQEMFAERAKGYYDYRVMGSKLVRDINEMRRTYDHRVSTNQTT